MNITYTVDLYKPNAHILSITLTIANPDKNGQVVSLPAWIPGSYMIRDFAKNIINIKASSNDKKIALEKIDKSTWKAEATPSSVRFEYQVYAWDLSVRSAHFDMTHAFFNGTSVFLMPHGFENEASIVTINQPVDTKYTDWKVCTSLQAKEINQAGFGSYQSTDYDDLIDHPIEIGTHNTFSFTVENTRHTMAFTGIHRADNERLKRDLTKICQHHCTMFGELPAEIDEYIFLTMVTGDGYGGLEHRSSTSLMCSRNDLPLHNHPDEPDEKYRNFLGLCSHEYFHTWNVKRIKPDSFIPYQLDKETYTRQLWAFEGITSYYDELALIRSKVISLDSYLELLGQTITRVLRGKGRLNQSIADSSFDAWTKFYKQDESAPNTIVSYYAKGGLLVLCLDLIIRKETDNEKSLDDVMRYLWQNYGKKLVGVPEGKIESIASDISGIELSSFFEKYLYNVEELPLESLLSDFGIQFNLRATTTVDDKGGKATDNNMGTPLSVGARFAEHPVGAKITHVFTDGSAEAAGLSAEDIIVAVNNIKVSKADIEKTLASYEKGSKLKLHAFRRDELYEFELEVKEAEMTTCYLVASKDTSPEISIRQQKWLHL